MRELLSEVRPMIRLATPIVLVQVGMMSMGVVDTLMVGRVSAQALAAVALGNLYAWAVLVFGMGVLLSVDPLVAQAVGAGDDAGAARAIQRGLWLAGALAIPITALLLPGHWVLAAVRQPPDVIPDAARYALWSAPGVFPFLAFVVLRQSLQAMERTAPVVVAILAANAVNLLLNWLLIFGHGGFAPRGAVGAAIATSISRWLMAGVLLAAGWRGLRAALVRPEPGTLAPGPIWRMARLGAPIGTQFVVEMGAFGTIALLMGYLGTRDVAAHQIAINLASLTFMVPLGLSAAAAVRVGHAAGRGDAAAALRASRVALVLGAAFMALMAALLTTCPGLLARAYTSDPAVAAVAAALLPIAGFFQVLDGLQVVAAGILRGLGDTRAPMLINVLGFWAVGMPVSLWLAFRVRTGPEGLWWGLVAGLAAVALLLLARVAGRLRSGRVGRISVEDAPPDGVVYDATTVDGGMDDGAQSTR